MCRPAGVLAPDRRDGTFPGGVGHACRVRPHLAIQSAVRAWRLTLGATREERDRVARERWAEFEQSVIDSQGPPPGSVEDASTRPPTYWCDFPGGGLAQILVQPDRREWVFTVVREVVVVNLVFSPGPPD